MTGLVHPPAGPGSRGLWLCGRGAALAGAGAARGGPASLGSRRRASLLTLALILILWRRHARSTRRHGILILEAADFLPPPGAVDAHCHVFGPGDRFPYAPQRKYTPTDAPKETLFALRRHLGLSRNVIVQASCHGRDNAALLDALRADPENCRGIAVVDPDIGDDELDEMHVAGVRGVRFNFVRRLVDPDPLDVSARLAARVAELGWHAGRLLRGGRPAGARAVPARLPGDVVIDHMGRPDIAAGVEAPASPASSTDGGRESSGSRSAAPSG